jgi:hypothetical protein
VLRRVAVPPCRLAILAFILGVVGCKSASTDGCDPTDPLCGANRVATSVTLDRDAVILTSVGATQQLVPTVLDQDGQPISGASVTWRSDNQGVVTVSTSGVVRAEGTGTTLVHATSGSAVAAVAAWVCVPTGTMTFEEVRFDNLAATDCQLADGSYADFWTLNITTAGPTQIDMLSATFDTYLFLLGPQGALLAEDDDHENQVGAGFYDTSARIDQTVTAGSYTIVATSFDPGSTGSYQLSVGPGLPCPEEAVISIPSVTVEALAGGDCTYEQYLSDMYVVRVSATGSVTFTVTSTQFDAYLTLFDPSGNIVYSDNNGAGGTNARISGPLTAAWYVVEVSSNVPGQAGSYTLTVN